MVIEEDPTPTLDGEFISRPVCRKKEPTEQLEDLDNVQERRYIHKRPISTPNLMRPPSRHKTPPKALGLDIPNEQPCYEKIKIEPLKGKRPSTSKPSSCKPDKIPIPKQEVKKQSWIDQDNQNNQIDNIK